MITVSMNRMGHLHIWNGDVTVSMAMPLNHKGDGRDSDEYIQSYVSDYMHNVLELSDTDISELEAGYAITMRDPGIFID